MAARYTRFQHTIPLLVFLTFFIISCQTAADTSPPGLINNPQPQNKLKLVVDTDGVYKLTRDQLKSAGMEVDQISAEGLRLSRRGEIVPAIYEPDSLIFYGVTSDSRYFLQQPYILESEKTGQEMAEMVVPSIDSPKKEFVTQIVHLEENHEYASEARSDDENDVWFWRTLRQQETFEVEIDLPHVENTSGFIRTNAWGFSFDRQVEDDHSFDLYLNETLIDTIVWDGQTFHTSESEIPPGVLKQGSNTILLDNQPQGASFLDIMQINWIELAIPTSPSAVGDQLYFSSPGGLLELSNFSSEPYLLNINQPLSPQLIQGWLYENERVHLPLDQEMKIAAIGAGGFLTPEIQTLQTSIWEDKSSQADLIIITTDNLAPALEPLIEHRQAEGLSVALLTVQEIYDVFGFGEPSPESIRRFVTFAYENWQEPKPKYLLIVGDGTTDYLGNLGDVPQNTVPSLIVPVQFSGETVSDSRLADINNDQRPDLAVGRWPLNERKDVESLVQRTLAYENGQASERVIFAADGSEDRFAEIAQSLTSSSSLNNDKVAILKGSSAQEIAEEWNKGSWLAAYIGHGSISRWGKEGMFELNSVEQLNNQKPPIVLQLTCLTGLFSHPVETSLTEAMLRHPNGPVLTVAATSLTLSSHQEPFALELLQQMQNPKIDRFGDAFQEAKLSLDISSNGLREISDTFALFGDPSARIVRPE